MESLSDKSSLKSANAEETIMKDLSNRLGVEGRYLVETLDLDEEDFAAFFNKSKISELTEEEITGLALFAYSIQQKSLELRANVSYDDYSSIRENAKAAPPAVDCFLEATGIAAGVAIIGVLSGEMVGKAAVKAAIKAAAKIGGRTLGGIGLALMAAEFSWCMLR